MSLENLIDGLAEANVSFVVVGMIAGQLYGARIATYDLDIVYDRSSENVDRLAAYLLRVEAYVKQPWPNEGVASDFSIEVLVNEGSLTLGTREGELDVLHRINGFESYADVVKVSRPMRTSNGHVARVIELEALIRAKRAAGREKDRIHLTELEALEAMQPPTSP